MNFDEKQRYARQIILPELGEAGQKKLKSAHVLVVGAGGLGSPLLLYLAAAGVGQITVIDHDRVSLNNLHRQILFETNDIDESKVDAAKDALHDLNPEITINVLNEKLTTENAVGLISSVDIVADGCDDIETRFLVADICAAQNKTLVTAAIHRFDGHLATFKPHLGAPHPSYRCLYPEMPPADAMPNCAEAGILGAVAGVLGSMQALEVIKEITGIGESLSGYLIRYDGLNQNVRKVKLPRSNKL